MGAVAALKWFRKLIQDFKEPDTRLRGYLLKELERREATADQFMVDLMNEFLKPSPPKPRKRGKK